MMIWVQPLFSAMDFLSISKYQHSVTSDCFSTRSFASGRPRSGLAPPGGEGGVCVLGPSVRLALVRWSRLRNEAAQTPARRAGTRVAKRNELVTKALVDS